MNNWKQITVPDHTPLEGAITTLDKGERWLVEPRKLDDEGKQWTPGVKTGVREGSYFHLTEFFGPVLGIMHAKDLDEAIKFEKQQEEKNAAKSPKTGSHVTRSASKKKQ